jgi:hypothetical protein
VPVVGNEVVLEEEEEEEAGAGDPSSGADWMEQDEAEFSGGENNPPEAKDAEEGLEEVRKPKEDDVQEENEVGEEDEVDEEGEVVEEEQVPEEGGVSEEGEVSEEEEEIEAGRSSGEEWDEEVESMTEAQKRLRLFETKKLKFDRDLKKGRDDLEKEIKEREERGELTEHDLSRKKVIDNQVKFLEFLKTLKPNQLDDVDWGESFIFN